MQRVRIGITGLAVIFLLVLLTAALVGGIRRNAPSHAAKTPTGTVLGTDTPKEPLAELGVAPGSAPPGDNVVAPVPAGTPGLRQQGSAPR